MTRIIGEGESGGGNVDSVTGTLPIVVDNTDPANPVVTLPGNFVRSVTGDLPIVVDNTDPENPVVTLPGFSAGSSPLRANKNMAASVTVADGDLACATAVALTPATSSAGGGYIGVDVNGVAYSVGDGVKVGVACYFSGDGGVTARTMKLVVAGDDLYWNGSVALFQLEASDRINFNFEVST